jgi:hypothetical protein
MGVVKIAVFYSDWVLAAVTRNWAGVPIESLQTLYQVYFAAKRLPMLFY